MMIKLKRGFTQFLPIHWMCLKEEQDTVFSKGVSIFKLSYDEENTYRVQFIIMRVLLRGNEIFIPSLSNILKLVREREKSHE